MSRNTLPPLAADGDDANVAPGSEDAFLALIDHHFPTRHPHCPSGRGDDCAVLRTPDPLLLSSDLFLEDVHFRAAYCTPQDIGYKALAVNLSDIAAMGGVPLGFSLGLMAPAGRPARFWDALFSGLALAAEPWDLALAGGDLSRSERLGLCITIWGRPGSTGATLARGNCRPGDALFIVTAPDSGLGLARTGLRLLEERGRARALAEAPAAVMAHLRPLPLVDAGLTLAAMPGVRSLMDLSDGLVRDIPRLLGSGLARTDDGPAWPALGAELTLTSEALHPELRRFAVADPLAEALLGGEDYALLGAVEDAALDRLCRLLPMALPVGRVVDTPGLHVAGRSLDLHGFDHFSA